MEDFTHTFERASLRNHWVWRSPNATPVITGAALLMQISPLEISWWIMGRSLRSLIGNLAASTQNIGSIPYGGSSGYNMIVVAEMRTNQPPALYCPYHEISPQ